MFLAHLLLLSSASETQQTVVALVARSLPQTSESNTFRAIMRVEVNRPTLDLTLDAHSAHKVLALLERNPTAITPDELTGVVSLSGVQAVIDKARAYDPSATAASFRSALEAASQGHPLTDDPFELHRTLERLPGTVRLLAQLDEAKFAADLVDYLTPYLPEPLHLQARITITVGGTSDGWVPEPEHFVIAADWVGDDYEGLVLLAGHELYHVAQQMFMPQWDSRQPSVNARTAEDLLISTLVEGSASLLADPLRATQGGPYTSWFAEKYRHNLRRMALNFGLFDMLLYRAYHDPDVDPDGVYTLGFTGMMGSPLYFVGYRMAGMIERHLGREVLMDLYRKPAVAFFERYAALCDARQDPELIPFSASTGGIIADLAVSLGE